MLVKMLPPGGHLLRPSDESYLMLHKGLFTDLRALKIDINYA